MTHDLGPIVPTPDGYEASCSCGADMSHPHRSGVTARHEHHQRIADLRSQLPEDKR